MLKLVMNGVMLLTMHSCFKHAPTINSPVEMYIIEQSLNEAGRGHKNLNYKARRDKVGEWVKDLEFMNMQDAPNDLMCYPLKTWLKTVKPKLKEGSQHFHDYNYN